MSGKSLKSVAQVSCEIFFNLSFSEVRGNIYQLGEEKSRIEGMQFVSIELLFCSPDYFEVTVSAVFSSAKPFLRFCGYQLHSSEAKC